MHIKVLTCLLGIILGVVCGAFLPYSTEIALCAGVLGIAECGLYFFARQKQNTSKHENYENHFLPPLLSGMFFISFAIGIIRVQFTEEHSSFVCERVCTFKATIVTSPEVKDEYQVFVVDIAGENDEVYDVQVKAPLYPRLSVGEVLTLSGRVTEPKGNLSHGDVHAFDYVSYLHVHNIGSEMFYPNIELQKTDGSVGVGLYLAKLKERFLQSITHHVEAPAASLGAGMLFGDASMSKELLQTFRVAGLSHIVVLSGFNIAILISFVLVLLVFVPLVLRVFIAGIFVILFVVMVGGGVSLIRATLMSFVALAALLLGRPYTARHALLLSLLVITLYDPKYLLNDVSLHLSFLATAGIVYMSDGIKSVLTRLTSTLYKEVLTTTLAAYLSTLPYVMYTFGTISLYALIANLVVLPLVPLMMLFTFLVVVTAPFIPLLGVIFGFITTLIGRVIIVVGQTVENLPISSVKVSVSLVMMTFLYGGILIVFYFFIHRKKHHNKNETLPTNNTTIFSEVISY